MWQHALTEFILNHIQTCPERFMAAADVFCLPSYREGFGMAIIEAASAGIPSIGTRIYGVTDAIDEGKTGCLYAPRNVDELASKDADDD